MAGPGEVEEIEFSEEESEPIVVQHHEFTDDEAIIISGKPGQNAVLAAPRTEVVAEPGDGGRTPTGPYEGILETPGLSPLVLTSPRGREPDQEGGGEGGGSGYDRALNYPAQTPQERLQQLAKELERLVGLGGPGYHTAVYHLEKANLSPEDLRTLFGLLRDRGVLGDFLDYARRPEMWDYLRRRGVDWEFVFMNYAYGPRDSVDFFAGFVAGVLGNVGETLMIPLDVANALYVLTGSVFDEELAARRDAFVAGLTQLLTNPVVTAKLVGESWWREFNERLGRLQWFQAGAMLGKVVPDVVAAVKATPGLVKGATSLAAKLPALTKKMLAVRITPADLASLAKAIKNKMKNWVSSNGYRVEEVEGERVLRGPDGKLEGRLEVTDQDLAEWEADFEKWRNQAGDNPDMSEWVITKDIVDPVVSIDFRRMAVVLRRTTPQGTMTAQQWGTAIHAKAAEWLRSYFTSIGHPDIDVLNDRAFRGLAGFDPRLADLTVRDFLARFPEVRALTSVPGDKELLATKIGDLKPDLVVVNRVTGQAIVADLAPAEVRKHMRKTQLYSSILEKSVPGIRQVIIGEYYYARSQ